MGALIDASVLIAAGRGKLDLEAILDRHREESFALATVTASDLLHAVHRAQDATLTARREAWVEALLERLPVVPFDLVTARLHARLAARLAAGGAVIGPHELIVAATALARGWEVVTRDERSYPQIRELTLVRW